MSRDYFQTYSGIINIVLLVINTIGFICIVSEVSTNIGVAFTVVAVLGFFITSSFSLVHFSRLNEKLHWPWAYMEMIYAQVWMVLYLIMSGLVLSVGFPAYIAAGIFGLMAVITYIIKSLHTYLTQIISEATSVYVRT